MTATPATPVAETEAKKLCTEALVEVAAKCLHEIGTRDESWEESDYREEYIADIRPVVWDVCLHIARTLTESSETSERPNGIDVFAKRTTESVQMKMGVGLTGTEAEEIVAYIELLESLRAPSESSERGELVRFSVDHVGSVWRDGKTFGWVVPWHEIADKPGEYAIVAAGSPSSETERIEDQLLLAITFAVEAHAGQIYHGYGERADEPYISHPLRVMMAVEPDYRIVAVLHDCQEDAGVLPDWLRTRDRVAIDMLSRTDKPYEQYIAEMNAKGTAGVVARAVKRADLMDNLAHDPPARLKARYIAALAALRSPSTAEPETKYAGASKLTASYHGYSTPAIHAVPLDSNEHNATAVCGQDELVVIEPGVHFFDIDHSESCKNCVRKLRSPTTEEDRDG